MRRGAKNFLHSLEKSSPFYVGTHVSYLQYRNLTCSFADVDVTNMRAYLSHSRNAPNDRVENAGERGRHRRPQRLIGASVIVGPFLVHFAPM
jgi:hypothetical protein